MEFIDLCKKIIRIDSTPSAGNVEVAQFCAKLCKEAGLFVELQEGALFGMKQYNLIARPQKQKPQEEVIFQTHLDTVEPGPLGHWTKTDHKPFEAVVEGDHIYGLGVADVKLDFLCKLRALKDLKDQKMSKPFVIVGTFGEEVGMVGARQLMDTKALNAKNAVIGEPSELQIVYANNGLMVIEFEIPFSEQELKLRSQHSSLMTQEKMFSGKAAHSSTPHLGESAIYKLIDYLERLPQGAYVQSISGGVSINTVPAEASVEVDPSRVCQNSASQKLVELVRFINKLEREFLGFSNEAFSPSHPTANVAMIRTSSEEIKVFTSYRITPNISTEQVSSWVERLGKKCEELGCFMEEKRRSNPAMTDVKSPLIQAAIETAGVAGTPRDPITKASGTESSVYRQYGLDCMVIGPGVSIGNSHTANEFNYLSQLEKVTDFYRSLAQRFCQ